MEIEGLLKADIGEFVNVNGHNEHNDLDNGHHHMLNGQGPDASSPVHPTVTDNSTTLLDVYNSNVKDPSESSRVLSQLDPYPNNNTIDTDAPQPGGKHTTSFVKGQSRIMDGGETDVKVTDVQTESCGDKCEKDDVVVDKLKGNIKAFIAHRLPKHEISNPIEVQTFNNGEQYEFGEPPPCECDECILEKEDGATPPARKISRVNIGAIK